MTRREVVGRAIDAGWKQWGALRRYGGSSYQCFRRRSEYLWIGLRFVERTGCCTAAAADFVSEHDRDRVIRMIEGKDADV